jgi:hypothetical protein
MMMMMMMMMMMIMTTDKLFYAYDSWLIPWLFNKTVSHEEVGWDGKIIVNGYVDTDFEKCGRGLF